MIAILLLADLTASMAGLPEVHLLTSDNLQIDGRKAEGACIPLLLEFSALGCEYCDLLEEEILKPILRNREYDQRVLIRKIMVDQESIISGFDGIPVSPAKLTYHYKVFVTPTLLFVDSHGNELTERMIGVTTLEMYGGYLDLALDASAEKLHQANRCQPVPIDR